MSVGSGPSLRFVARRQVEIGTQIDAIRTLVVQDLLFGKNSISIRI
jgi:hypothetical protein